MERTCPQCNSTENKPYMDGKGIAMRACFRCLIQWQDFTIEQQIQDLRAELSKAEGQLEVAVNGLRHYADKGNWSLTPTSIDDPDRLYDSYMGDGEGYDKAIEVLNQIGETKR